MKYIKIITTIACIHSIAITTSTAAEKQTDLLSIKGKTRSELQSIFPGKETHIKEWNEFKSISLYFNAKGRLNQACVTLKTPIEKQEAEVLLKSKLGIDISGFKKIDTHIATRFESTTSEIKTVTLRKKIPGKSIEEITLTYSIGFNE